MPEAVAATGAEILLGNTYHLMLRPAPNGVERLGGLHRMMNWPRPILTDSGGFQVMSLTGLRELNEHGVTFRSHIDGSKHELTPERSIEIQRMLDADITMALDECTPHPATYEQTARLARPVDALGRALQASLHAPARLRAFRHCPGRRPSRSAHAIGRAAAHDRLRRLRGRRARRRRGSGDDVRGARHTAPALPEDHPRYLMGVGTPADLVGAVQRGIDMFDCVMPTRSGRTGQAFTRRGKVNIRNARHLDDPRPLDAECRCPACTGFSRAYLHHLHRSEEMLGPILLTWHNLTYYQDLMASLRAAIEAGSLADTAAAFSRDARRRRCSGAVGEE